MHVLRERPQPREGTVSELPDWPPPAPAAQHSRRNGADPAVQSSAAASPPAARQASHSQQHVGAASHWNSSPGSRVAGQPSRWVGGSRASASASSPGLHLQFREVCFTYSQPAHPDGAAAAAAPGAAGAAAVHGAAAHPGAAGVSTADAPMQLQGISFTVQPGEVIGVVGPPGKLSFPAACLSSCGCCCGGILDQIALADMKHHAAMPR